METIAKIKLGLSGVFKERSPEEDGTGATDFIYYFPIKSARVNNRSVSYEINLSEPFEYYDSLTQEKDRLVLTEMIIYSSAKGFSLAGMSVREDGDECWIDNSDLIVEDFELVNSFPHPSDYAYA